MRPIVTIVAGVIAAVVVLWLVVLICFASLRPPGATLRDAVRIVPDAIRLVHRLARSRQLDRGARVRLYLLLGYLAIPIDLVPDVIPVIGYADDAIVIGVVLRSVIRRAGLDIVREHWPGLRAAGGLVLRGVVYQSLSDTDAAGHVQPSTAGPSVPSAAGPAGFDEAALVGEHDRLHPVAQPQLGEDVGDVGLDRALADVQVGGELGVALAGGQQLQHLSSPAR